MRLLQRGDSVRKGVNENRPLKLMLTGFVIIGFIGLIQTFVPSLLAGLVAVPTLMVIVLVAIALLVSILFGTQPKDASEKRKRQLEGLEMYSMIDRLFNDLDGDELVYLRRRLEEREQGKGREFSQSLETLLEERAEERQTQQQ
jgi:hypothetical protein